MTLTTITVSQLNAHVKRIIDSDGMFSSVLVTGEISNFSPHYKTGHLYFSLKDESASVKAVMFAREAGRLRFRPADGMKVIAAGRVSVFERDGTYQLYVRELIPDGAGELAIAFQQLKKRLEAKGLFDPAHKQQLPQFPQRIGIITSPGSAALQDMLNILNRRYPLCTVIVSGVTVQGARASAEICAAIEEFNRLDAADLLIVGRGGGSAEDLWCFNDETLAYAIYNSSIPIISAVGHETDFSISDFVSDLRAPTPSAAAELAVPDIEDLTYRVAAGTQKLFACCKSEVEKRRQLLQLLCARQDFSDPGVFFSEDKNRVSALKRQLFYHHSHLLHSETKRYQEAQKKLRIASAEATKAQKLHLTRLTTALESLNPLSVLLRGYAIIHTEGGIKESADAYAVGEEIDVLLSDGTLRAKVTGIAKGKNCND